MEYVFGLALATVSVGRATTAEIFTDSGFERLEININSYFPLDDIEELISDDEIEKYGRHRISDDKFKAFHSKFDQRSERSVKGQGLKYDFKAKSRRLKRHAHPSKAEELFDTNYDNIDKTLIAKLSVKRREMSSKDRQNREVKGKPSYTDGREKLRLVATRNPKSMVETDDSSFDYSYDYDQFHREYYAQLETLEQEKLLFSPQPEKKLSLVNMADMLTEKKANESEAANETLCGPEDWKSGVGLIALVCLAKHSSESGFTDEVVDRFLGIVKFWVIAYAVIGGFMWVSCGYCCCFLKCKIFKPDLIRKEARAYLVNNPPGITKDNEGRLSFYDPPEYEMKAYKDLEIKAFIFM